MAAPLRISRVATLVPEFRSRHVATRQPVVIDGLFDGQPIRRLATARAAQRAIGDMDFVVQWNYISEPLLRKRREKRDSRSARRSPSYLDYVALNARTPRMCIEQPIAPTLAALIQGPAMCWNNEHIATLMFIGNAGNFSHLHFDGDQRQVLMYQVFGGQARHPDPADRSEEAVAAPEIQLGLCPAHVGGRERRAFLRYVGGSECLVRPGQAIFMPALFWHHVEYVETSLSVHFRFGQTQQGRFFDDFVHRSMYPQNVAACFQDEQFAAGPGRKVMRRLRRAVAGTIPQRPRAIRAHRGAVQGALPAAVPRRLHGHSRGPRLDTLGGGQVHGVLRRAAACVAPAAGRHRVQPLGYGPRYLAARCSAIAARSGLNGPGDAGLTAPDTSAAQSSRAAWSRGIVARRERRRRLHTSSCSPAHAEPDHEHGEPTSAPT